MTTSSSTTSSSSSSSSSAGSSGAGSSAMSAAACVVPRPARVAPGVGTFALTAATGLTHPPELAAEAVWLRGALGPATGCFLAPGPGIALLLDPDALPAEGYRLEVTASTVELRGGSAAGVFAGLQTLRQLLPAHVFRRARVGVGEWSLPVCVIEDEPAFGRRGVMLDVARHFLPKQDVLRFVDLMAVHRLNVLHLHLTDDQGWRIEVPRWPRLTSVGAWRTGSMRGSRQHETFDERPHGGYYTGDDLREIVAYAADRHITVVPEIDLPAHVQAAVAAYPSLGAVPVEGVRTRWGGLSDGVLAPTEEALGFCRDVLAEVCAIFPSRYVCVGGDEVPTGPWERMGHPDPGSLGGWFVAELAGMLAAHGRLLFGWDEVLAGGAAVPSDALIGGWRGEHGTIAAARAGFDVVACPDTSVYLDYRQGEGTDEPIPVGPLLTLANVYAFRPVPSALSAAEGARVLGGQAQIWTEHMDSARRIDYMAFPRLCAFAEAVWSGPGDFADFTTRLTSGHLARLDALGVEYRPLDGPHPWQTRPDALGWPRERADREAELLELTKDIRGGMAGEG
ncbi:beta-N-acetylhexosaminidase [Embleya sp. NPDC005575]|uniref:beta-N-acetylhexosaminidase n=1 Tax=Embleya sp. NPDC005575 TaxID=3156892 RepID=UPI0033A07FEC